MLILAVAKTFCGHFLRWVKVALSLIGCTARVSAIFFSPGFALVRWRPGKSAQAIGHRQRRRGGHILIGSVLSAVSDARRGGLLEPIHFSVRLFLFL